MKAHEEKIENIRRLIADYFDGDSYKIALWMSTENPGLGNISPIDMICMNRYNNLRNFVLAALDNLEDA